jgi:hypothetical protein
VYPLNYVLCHPKHRISGVSDYLAIRRNSPDPLSCEALGSSDRLLTTHRRLHHKGRIQRSLPGVAGCPPCQILHVWGQLLLDAEITPGRQLASASLNLGYSLTRRNSMVTALALSIHSHCITSGFPQGRPPPYSSKMMKGKMS